MAKDAFAPVTPGEMLKEEFLVEYGLTQNHLAKAIGISPNRIAEIVNNRRRITADTALRLSLYFGNSPEFWMNLQTHYDLKIARRNLDAKAIKRIKDDRSKSRPPKFFKITLVIDGNRDPITSRRFDALVNEARIVVETVTEAQAQVAREALRFWQGQRTSRLAPN
jgi:antitoxin HigA-1